MEKQPEKLSESDIFYRRLKNEGLVDEIRPSLNIVAENYTFVSGEEFAVQDLINSLAGYLSAPTLIDSFSSHEEDRVPAFNKSGVLDSDANKELYLLNRLRLNKISSTLRTLRATTRVKELPESFRTFISAQIKDLNMEHYNELSNEEKISFTETLANVCVEVLNRAIEEGLIEGQVI